MKQILCLLLVAFCFSCQSREQKLITSVESFVLEVQANDSIFTNEDWDQADKQMETYNNEFQELRNSLTNGDRDKINQLIGRYQGLRIKRGIKDFKNAIEDLGEQVKGAAEVFTDSVTK